jgi:hypothetical protein
MKRIKLFQKNNQENNTILFEQLDDQAFDEHDLDELEVFDDLRIFSDE